MSETPFGEPVASIGDPGVPQCRVYAGRYVSLHPVDPEADLGELYEVSHGSREKERIWSYLPYGPFTDRREFAARLSECKSSRDPLYLTVRSTEHGRRVGMLSFLNIVPANRTVELGHIWYGTVVHRTRINTESIYLMLCECFERLRYRRVEWKCNALNRQSREAALRFGFSFEGIFRQHMIVKGRNRDSAWFALLDGDWPAVKTNMERWLGSDGVSLSLTSLNAPLLRATGW